MGFNFGRSRSVNLSNLENETYNMNTSHYQFECMINIKIYSLNIIHQLGLFTSLIIVKKMKQLGRFSFPKLFLFIIINYFQSPVLLFTANTKFYNFIFF